MSCLRMCLSLLYVATSLQGSASSNDEVADLGVSLECNKTVEVVAGETVTLNCTYLEQHCKGLRYLWSNTHGDIPCNSSLMKHTREWDNLIYVSLTISNVVEEEKYTFDIETDCGTVESSDVKIQLKQQSTSTHEVSNPGVSLECNKTMEVVAGETVTLYCTYLEQHCKGERYLWSNTHGDIPCNSDLMKHTREWDNLTYVSLTISNVVEEEKYTFDIETDCGTVESSDVKIQLKQQSTSTHGVSNPGVSNPGVSNPGVSSPEVSNPGVSNPGVSSPEVSNPGVSNPGVSLKCNKTVEAVAGEMVTLYCTISYLEQHCKGLRYLWRDTHGGIPCNSDFMKYSCEWDNLIYASLIISNIVEEENYTVDIETDCGTVQSSVIKVRLKQQSNSTHGETGSEQPTKPHVTPTILRLFTLIVLVVLFFLFGTDRGREIVKCIKNEKTPEDPSDMDTGPE